MGLVDILLDNCHPCQARWAQLWSSWWVDSGTTNGGLLTRGGSRMEEGGENTHGSKNRAGRPTRRTVTHRPLQDLLLPTTPCIRRVPMATYLNFYSNPNDGLAYTAFKIIAYWGAYYDGAWHRADVSQTVITNYATGTYTLSASNTYFGIDPAPGKYNERRGRRVVREGWSSACTSSFTCGVYFREREAWCV